MRYLIKISDSMTKKNTMFLLLSIGFKPAMGEFKVHRVRFFEYMPSGIRALAFNPLNERMAVARMDGSVEILHCSDRYFQEKVHVK